MPPTMNKQQTLTTVLRVLEKHYDDWNLVRLRGSPNDELLMAIAMAEAGLEALPDQDDSIMAPFNVYPHCQALDVFKGRCEIANPPLPHWKHRAELPVKTVRPLIPHFVGYYTDHWRYKSEAFKLRYVAGGLPLALARMGAALFVVFPGIAAEIGKLKLRPLYRNLFGVRCVRASTRV